jgi:hypothetical protein
MISKEFDAITKADIDSLVANAVAERRTIEYKQQLPGATDEDKKEFLADVSSFANAAGGDIIYGITEQRDENGKPTGIPELADGLAGINADEQKRRLEEIIRSGIDPRVPGIRVGHYDGFPSGPVFVIRVPKSWVSPHMVTFKNLSRFFARNSTGKQQLDVREIRAGFTASGDLRSKLTAFSTGRLGTILANGAPMSLPAAPKFIFHLIPLSILDSAIQVDLSPLENDPNLSAPIQDNCYNNRHNLDGFLSYNMSRDGGGGSGYCQVFRSGAFEVVETNMFRDQGVIKLVVSTFVERTIIQAASRYFKTARQIGTPLPLIVMVTFFGLKGFGMATSSASLNFRPIHTIDRDTLLLPDVLLEDYNTPADVVLKPIFDAFWQSAGFPACQHYDNQGRWINSLR